VVIPRSVVERKVCLRFGKAWRINEIMQKGR
jgi:hypothetical protein